MENITDSKTILFNGFIETALRSLIILEAFYPCPLDLDTISLLDYFVVHTADIGGPSSLHPAVSSRVGEYRVRRRTIQDSLKILIRRNLIVSIEAEDGIRFVSGDDAPAFIKLLATDYNRTLAERANWLALQAKHHSNLFADMRAHIDNRTMEFQFDEGYSIA